MAEKVFDRDTLLDLTVNFIPLGILALFFVAFVVFTPFGFDSVITTIQLAIIAVSALGLLALTYYSGMAVSKAEKAEADVEAERSSLISDKAPLIVGLVFAAAFGFELRTLVGMLFGIEVPTGPYLAAVAVVVVGGGLWYTLSTGDE
jgi:archaellum biogenesis protein FlaJ (TadC family)